MAFTYECSACGQTFSYKKMNVKICPACGTATLVLQETVAHSGPFGGFVAQRETPILGGCGSPFGGFTVPSQTSVTYTDSFADEGFSVNPLAVLMHLQMQQQMQQQVQQQQEAMRRQIRKQMEEEANRQRQQEQPKHGDMRTVTIYGIDFQEVYINGRGWMRI